MTLGTNIHIIGVLKGEEREIIFADIIAENFQNLVQETDI